MKRTTPILLAWVVLLSGSAKGALASFTEADAFICMSNTTGGCGIFRDESTVFSGTAALNGTFGSAGVQSQLTANISATSTYGVLHAGESSALNISGTAKYTAVIGEALFEDVITISSPTFNGSPGLDYVSYNLDGTVSGSSVNRAFAEVNVFSGTSLQQQYSALFSSSVSGTFNIPQPIQFTYGVPFGLYFLLSVNNGTIEPLPGGDGYGQDVALGSGIASTDFLDTLTLSGLVATDQFGNVVGDAQYSSSSGTVYGADGVVPEPATFFLMAGGLLLIAKCKGVWFS